MLTSTGCRERQQRLRRALAAQNLDAAVISDRHEIYYFTGVLLPIQPFSPPALAWVDAKSIWVIVPKGSNEGAVDETLTYERSIGATSNPDWTRRINDLLGQRLSGVSAKRIGYQAEALPLLLSKTIDATVHPDEWVALDDTIEQMERVKDADELDLIRRSIEIDLAAYRAAQGAIQPGVRELDVLAAAVQAAYWSAGEIVYHNGDYHSAADGGDARDRSLEGGELYIIDAWTNYRGYWSDLSRTFVVGEEITDTQQSIFDHIRQVQEAVPNILKPGIDGTEVWRQVDALIRQHPLLAEKGLVHHAGHAVGLRAHELPDLNPTRGGTLEVGCVISVEPGAYIEPAGAWVRLENMYLITETGAELLSVYPMSLR